MTDESNFDPPSMTETAARRRNMMGKMIELHGLDSSYVQSYAIVQCCFLLTDLVTRHDSIYQKVNLLHNRMEWLEKHLATLSLKKTP